MSATETFALTEIGAAVVKTARGAFEGAILGNRNRDRSSGLNRSGKNGPRTVRRFGAKLGYGK